MGSTMDRYCGRVEGLNAACGPVGVDWRYRFGITGVRSSVDGRDLCDPWGVLQPLDGLGS